MEQPKSARLEGLGVMRAVNAVTAVAAVAVVVLSGS